VVEVAEEISISFAWWGPDFVNAFQLEVAEKFTELTGIRVDPIYSSWADYWVRINTMAAANDLPDLMRQDYSMIAQYARNNQLLPLEPFIDAGIINLDDVNPVVLSGGIIDGTLYGINIGSNTFAMIYNQALIEEVGMSVPDETLTWDAYLDFAVEFHNRTGFFGTQIPSFVLLEFFLRVHGEEFYTPDGRGPGFTVATMQKYFEDALFLLDNGAIPGPDTLAHAVSVEETEFIRGLQATAFVWKDAYPTWVNAKGHTLGITVIPGAGPTNAMYMRPSQFHSITHNANNTEAAALFIDYWNNNVEINRIVDGRRGVPISASMAEYVRQNLDEVGQIIFGYMDFAQTFARPIAPPHPAGHSEVEGEFRTLMERVLFRVDTPEAAAQEFYDFATAVLAQN